MISYIENDIKFNFRVGCFIFDKSEEYILIHRKINHNIWMLPGGRVEIFEDTNSAIIRELKEELDMNIEDLQLCLICELFYEYNNQKKHEIIFDFLYNVDYKIEKEEEFTGIEGEYMIFKWIKLENIDDYNFFNKKEVEYIQSKRKKEGIIRKIYKR